jgi:hypothetical protein
MVEATPDTLLDKALEKAPAGLNNAGIFLAQQLHWNRYSPEDAFAVMSRYVAAVGCPGYGEREARASLKSAYKQRMREPWTGGDPSVIRKDWKAQRARRSFPTGPPAAPKPDPKAAAEAEQDRAKFERRMRTLKPFLGSPAQEYLATRGIPADLAKASRVKYCPVWGFEGSDGIWVSAPAVMFLLRDSSGNVVAAQGRRLQEWPGKNKIIFAKKIPHDGVFSTPGALDADPVAITEAPIDALTLALAGIPAIALCRASGLPVWLVDRLAKPAATTPAGYSRTVYIALDNDHAGEPAAATIGATLPLVRTARLRPNRKDWNEDLTTGGLDSLREWLQRASSLDTRASTGQNDSTPVLDAGRVESARVQALEGKLDNCVNCGATVVYVPAAPWGWWYECASCDDCQTVPLIPTEETNPMALF